MADMNLRGIPDDLHRKAKAQATMEGISLKALIIKLLEDYLKKKEGSSRLDLIKSIFNHPDIDLLKRAGERFDVRFFSFDQDLKPETSAKDAGKWLVGVVLQQAGGADCQGIADPVEEGPQRLHHLLRKVGGKKGAIDSLVVRLLHHEVHQPVGLDELVEDP